MSLKKSIYEHLKTRKKYNTLLLKYEVLQEELERKTVELNTERRIREKLKNIWETNLKMQEDEILRLKKRGIKNASSSSKKKKDS